MSACLIFNLSSHHRLYLLLLMILSATWASCFECAPPPKEHLCPTVTSPGLWILLFLTSCFSAVSPLQCLHYLTLLPVNPNSCCRPPPPPWHPHPNPDYYTNTQLPTPTTKSFPLTTHFHRKLSCLATGPSHPLHFQKLTLLVAKQDRSENVREFLVVIFILDYFLDEKKKIPLYHYEIIHLLIFHQAVSDFKFQLLKLKCQSILSCRSFKLAWTTVPVISWIRDTLQMFYSVLVMKLLTWTLSCCISSTCQDRCLWKLLSCWKKETASQTLTNKTEILQLLVRAFVCLSLVVSCFRITLVFSLFC